MMSKLRRSFLISFAAFAVILQLFNNSQAQSLEANIKIQSIEPPVLRVEGKFPTERTNRNWTFINSVAGAENLGEKISDFVLIDKNGQTVAIKKLQSGEYLAENSAIGFSYKIDLRRKEKIYSMAHISWLSNEEGLLMLDDLLPQFGKETKAIIGFDLPEGWRVGANELNKGRNPYSVSYIEKTVFYVGKNWREKSFGVLNLLISGNWQFSDDEAAFAAFQVFREYEKLFGVMPNYSQQIFLLKFPAGTPHGNWEAETRGANIVILSSDMPFQTQGIQRLHEQFRHEIFHFWMPNDLALTGRYDWFYEGFALYQSLRTGVELNSLRFEDFLDTLSRAYNLDSFQTQRISLIEASKNRWSGGNSQVYARGMLTAFLCDIAILKESKGRRDLTEVLREIYQKHRKPNKESDGNTAILQILKARRELKTIVEKYIESAENIEWQTDLEAIGIEAKIENSFTKLAVKAKLNSRQKDLLNELGYNNWRKLVQKSNEK